MTIFLNNFKCCRRGNGVSEVREDHNRFMQTSKMERMSKCFYSYGKLCSRHPWEVIVAFLTFSICLMTIAPSSSSCSKGQTSSSWSLFGNKSCQYRVRKGAIIHADLLHH